MAAFHIDMPDDYVVIGGDRGGRGGGHYYISMAHTLIEGVRRGMFANQNRELKCILNAIFLKKVIHIICGKCVLVCWYQSQRAHPAMCVLLYMTCFYCNINDMFLL